MVTRAGGWLLLICCAVLLMTAVAVGERPTSYAQLRAAVQDGDVDEVTVAGGSTPPGRGRYEVEVHWNAGLVRRVSTVVEARSSGPFGRVTGDSRTVVPSVEEDLGSFREGIAVERGTEYTGYSETFGWRLPQWAGPLGLVVWLGTFVALVIGPPPWRANRWAWFWMLVFASPVGLVAFLVLGGPTGLLPADPSRPRLRGGWGLVLALGLGMALSALLAASTATVGA